MTNDNPATPPAKIVVEEPVRLSRSILWRLQRSFFERQGVEAWSRGTVPHYITSNPFLAGAYAKVVLGWLRDCARATLEPGEPVYIVELGAGSGRFAFHFLQALRRSLGRSSLRDVPVRYVMTDLVQGNVDHWRAHPSLRPFVEQGLLDFARFDAEHDDRIALVESGQVLAPGTVKNPLGVVANYFFDSIPQDAFSVRRGVLHESRISLLSPQAEPDLADPAILSRAEVAVEERAISADYYGDPDLDDLLRHYEGRLANTTFQVPCAAIHCLGRLRRLSGDRLMLLTGDKGHVREDELLDQGGAGVVVHGSFSLMVNYHAIGHYFVRHGGRMLWSSHRGASLRVSAFLLGAPPGGHLETALAYDQAIENTSPDDLFTLRGGLEKHYAAMSLPEILAVLRLSGWDATVLLGAFTALIPLVSSAAEPLRQDVRWALQRVWDRHYFIGEKMDLPFCIGTLLYEMTYYAESLSFFERSVEHYGLEASTLYNMGMCNYRMHRPDAAHDLFERALAVDPAFESARGMKLKIQTDRERIALEGDA